MLELDSDRCLNQVYVLRGPKNTDGFLPMQCKHNCSVVYTQKSTGGLQDTSGVWQLSVAFSLSPHPTGIAKCSSFGRLWLVPLAVPAATTPQPEPLPTAGEQQHQQHIQGTNTGTGTRDVPRHFISPPKQLLTLHICLTQNHHPHMKKKPPGFFLEPAVIYSSCIVRSLTSECAHFPALAFLVSRLLRLIPQASSWRRPRNANSINIQPRNPEEMQSFQNDV